MRDETTPSFPSAEGARREGGTPSPQTGRSEATAGPFESLRRAWWHARFFGHAFMHRDFNDPRVQRLVEEKIASKACALCGRDPAAGLAAIGDFRFCHGDSDDVPTCYMIAASRTSLHDHEALVRGEMSVEDYVRRLKVRVDARMQQGAPW